MNYPALPEPPNAELNEPLAYYGVRLLMFVAATNVTATMSDRDLELAEHCAPYALRGRGTDTADLIVVEHIRGARQLIETALKGRKKMAQEQKAVTSVGPHHKGDEGAGVPVGPVPFTQPPAASFAEQRRRDAFERLRQQGPKQAAAATWLDQLKQDVHVEMDREDIKF